MWLGGFLERLAAIILKEVLPLSRDKLSFAMLFGMPILELLIFGYAINTDPHNLPTAVVVADQSRITRTVLSALSNTGYMAYTHRPATEAEADRLLRRAHWNVKAAIVMQKGGLTYPKSLARLRKAHDVVREAIGEDVEARLKELLKVG